MRVRSLFFVVIVCLCGLAARGQTPRAGPDTFVGGAQALAAMRTLNDELLASRSATQTLEAWCRDHHLADEPTMVARLVVGAVKPPSADQRKRLQVASTDEVRYRHVQLQCGRRVLSNADNWYVPRRLTQEMNRLLENTETPFGTVVRPLGPSRQTLAVTMLWPGGPPIPDALFAHRAVLYTREHVPFAEVYEVYQREVLGP